MKRVLHISTYRRLVLAYGLNELAWSVGTLALAVLVYRRTGSALDSTAFFFLSQGLPALLTPVVVARMDQRSPRRVLPALYAVEALLFGILAWLTTSFSLPAVLLLVLADGCLSLVARSLARTTTVGILRPLDLLEEGNAVINLVFSGCYMAGPAIGGIVVATSTTGTALLIACVLFAAITVVLATAHGLPGGVSDPEPSRGRLRTALGFVRRDRALSIMLTLQGASMLAFAISIPVEVLLAERVLHAGAGGYGAMMSSWGAGAVIGSAFFARWRRRSGRVLITVSAVALGIGFVLMAAAPTIIVAAVGSVFGGAGNGAGIVASKTLLQQYTPQRWLAVVTSLSESMNAVGPALGIIVGGVATELTSVRAALALGAVGSLIIAAVEWQLLSAASLGDPPAPAPDHHGDPDAGTRVPIRMESRETLA